MKLINIANQLENKISQLKKHKADVNILRDYHKEFIKINKITSKSQQRFGSNKYNVFTK